MIGPNPSLCRAAKIYVRRPRKRVGPNQDLTRSKRSFLEIFAFFKKSGRSFVKLFKHAVLMNQDYLTICKNFMVLRLSLRSPKVNGHQHAKTIDEN